MSRELVNRVLPLVRQRFARAMADRLPTGSSEQTLVKQRAEMIFDHTVPGGKNGRSRLAVQAFEALQPRASAEERERFAQAAVGIEMVQSFYLIVDDIMDGSETRRGRPCWYKMPGVGMAAINDALMLDEYAVEVVQQLYTAHPNRYHICQSFRKSKQKTTIGQFLDSQTERKLNEFTWDRYELLVEHKTSHYTIFHPVELAMLAADVRAELDAVKKTAYQIGFMFQAQDDFLDVFGEPSVTGKIGTDLQDGKCTWVSTRALQLMEGKEEMRQRFERHFGSSDPFDVSAVKTILKDELNLPADFRKFEKAFMNKVMHDVHALPISSLRPVLEETAENLVNRQK